MSWRFHLSKADPGAEAEEVKALTDQFFVTLRAYAASLPPLPDAHPPSPGRKRVDELLKKPTSQQTWSEAYEVEQLLVHYVSGPTITRELDRRILEASKVLPPEITAHYEKQAKKATNDEEKRVLLLRLVNDLQWRYTVQEVERAYNKEITRTVSRFFSYALLLILVGVIVVTLLASLEPTGREGELPEPARWIAVVLIAGVAGGWGAMFSVLTGLRQRLHESSFDDLKLTRSKAVLLTRPLIGVGAALILFFFLQSGLLAGEVFPKLEENAAPGGKTLAMLLVWCFIAGFSEKLVPNLLARTARRASDEPPVTTGSPRPPVSAENRPPASAEETKGKEEAEKTKAPDNENP